MDGPPRAYSSPVNFREHERVTRTKLNSFSDTLHFFNKISNTRVLEIQAISGYNPRQPE